MMKVKRTHMRGTGLERRRFAVLQQLYGDDGLEIGRLPRLSSRSLPKLTQSLCDGVEPEGGDAPVIVSTRHMHGSGLVYGASGAGKSYFLTALEDEMRHQSFGTTYTHVLDPKGETYELQAMKAAALWAELWESAPITPFQDVLAHSFVVNDVRADRITPANLYQVPDGMSPEVLAHLRAQTAIEAFGGEWSELMAFGVELVFRVVIDVCHHRHMGGLTVELVRALLFDRAARQTLLYSIRSESLRAAIVDIETTLPEQTRQAILRRFALLLGTRAARVLYGLSPLATKRLLPSRPQDLPLERAPTRLENFGPSLLRPPNVALAQAMNATVDVIRDIMVFDGYRRYVLFLEEAAQLLRNATVARYVLDASRTLRWKGLALVVCAQDPSNAFPKDVINTLALNARWIAAFQCARPDALLLEPYLPFSESTLRVNFALESVDATPGAAVQRMMTMPRQHFVFYVRGQSPFIVRARDVEDPEPESRLSRTELLDIFYAKIACHSMVRYDEAERAIAEETRMLLGAHLAHAADAMATLSADDLLREIEQPRGHQP